MIGGLDACASTLAERGVVIAGLLVFKRVLVKMVSAMAQLHTRAINTQFLITPPIGR